MIYLSSPYTHSDPWEVQRRVLATKQALAHLLEKGEFVYSPIVMCHAVANIHSLPTDHTFWLRFDFHMIEKCDEFAILRIDGWEKSRGMQAEYHHAVRLGKKITYI